MTLLSVAAAVLLAAKMVPAVPSDTLMAVACRESGNYPCTSLDVLSIHDNTAGRSYRPSSLPEAEQLASHLILDQGHVVDLGVMQVSFSHETRLGLTISQAFDPSKNMVVGGAILAAAYQPCVQLYRTAKQRLDCTFARYNAGKEDGAGRKYAAGVWNVAQQIVPSIAQVLRGGFPQAAPATVPDASGTRPTTNSDATPEGSVYARPAHSGHELVFTTRYQP